MMKKFLISSFILFLSLFGIKNANAATVSINGGSVGTSIEVPSFMTYYDITSSNSVSMLSTSSNPITLTYSTNFTTVTNSYGGIMAMKINTPFVKDFYYAITVYNWTTGAYGQLSTIPTVGISDRMGNAAQAALVGDGAWTLYRGIAGTAEICNYDRQTLQSFCGNATAYTFIIKATFTADAIAFPYTTDATCYNCLNTFYGYSIDSLGSKDDGITTQDVQNAINSSNLATASDIAEVQTSIQEVKQELSSIDNTMNNTNTTGAQDSANSFFEGFQTDDYGLSDIVTMPLELIKGLTSNTCVALNLEVPFVDKTLQLPCMSSIYQQYFGDFFTLYQTITFGFIAYWVIVKIFALVKGFKDPNDDKVEVLDL